MGGELLPESDLASFSIVHRIAAGGYGVVDRCIDPNGGLVAIKKELASSNVTRPILEHEYRIYNALGGHDSIPNVMGYGPGLKHNFLVMELLGRSLRDRFVWCGQRFTLKTTARLALGMLEAIEYVHSRGFIHRDIKPDNFVLGKGTKSRVVHLVDFGLARPWSHSTTTAATATAHKDGDGIIGSIPFASIPNHLGEVQARSDDLHALAYAILLFARGDLPWSRIRGSTAKHCARRILEKKRSWTAARLCQDLPPEFEAFCAHCLNLKFADEPDYSFLREKLTVIATRDSECNADDMFEWEVPGRTESEGPETVFPLPRQAPSIRRGDIVLLKLDLNKSIDYESPPRPFDSSFLPHQNTIPKDSLQPPYRPAVVREVVTNKYDDTYFSLAVYPLTRRSGLDGLSTHRIPSFIPLKTVDDAASGNHVPCNDVFIYKSILFRTLFKIEYDQAGTLTSQLSISESVLAGIEAEQNKHPVPYLVAYDSYDEETQAIRSRLPTKRWYAICPVMEMQPCCIDDLVGTTMANLSSTNGWVAEMINVVDVKRLENGRLSNDEDDSEHDSDTDLWHWPRAGNRRLSCTMKISETQI